MSEVSSVSPGSALPPRQMWIVLADDHPVFREGLKQLINGQPDMLVVAEAGDGEAAWHAAQQYSPDVLIIDLSMPILSGAETAQRVRRDCPNVKMLALTVHEDREYLTLLLKAGASGYVLKRAAPENIVQALRIVADGGTYVDPLVSEALVEGYLDTQKKERRGAALSERETEVLKQIARGFSNKEVASTLGISVKTVETYKARVMQKLGVRSRVEIVRYAAAEGWLM